MVAITKIAMSGRTQRMSGFCIITSSFISYGRQVQRVFPVFRTHLQTNIASKDNAVLYQFVVSFHLKYKKLLNIADFLCLLIEKYYAQSKMILSLFIWGSAKLTIRRVKRNHSQDTWGFTISEVFMLCIRKQSDCFPLIYALSIERQSRF
jgi:hypothetical protein